MNHLSNNLNPCIRFALVVAWLCGVALVPNAQAQNFAVVNAASYGRQGTPNPPPPQIVTPQVEVFVRTLAPDMITAAFGTFVTQNGQNYTASTNPLPTTLGGVRLQVNGVDAPLFFVSPGQINFMIPSTLADSTNVTLRVFNSNNTQGTGTCVNGPCSIIRYSPSIFAIKATGEGPAAALTTLDGITYKAVFNTDLSPAKVSVKGPNGQPNILVFYGTGIRRIPAANPADANGVAEGVTVTLQGVPLKVDYAGPAPGFVGLDQVNVVLPTTMEGFGLCRLVIQSKTLPANPGDKAFLSNAVDIDLDGTQPELIVARDLDLAQNPTVTGELTTDDQVQLLNDLTRRTYFFDVYRFRTTEPNQTIGIDMRRDDTGGNQLDSLVLLYRLDDRRLIQVGEEDDWGSADGTATGGEGIRATRNALMLTVLTTPGTYAIIASSANKQANGTGKYSLRLFSTPIRQLTYGQNLTGESITNADLKNSADVPMDVYYFNGNVGDNVDIRTTAPYISLLVLQRNGDQPLLGRLGDAVNPGQQARIEQRIGETNIYLIYVTPFERNAFGNYSLSLQRSASLDEAAQTESAAPTRITVRANPLSGREVTRAIEQ
jgi:uncharacterized protein (TIGR03437 family)